jgi:hypothetical protein
VNRSRGTTVTLHFQLKPHDAVTAVVRRTKTHHLRVPSMNANEFARQCRAEKDALLASYFDKSADTQVGIEIRNMNLDDPTLVALRQILDGALTDAFYTLLLGLDGAAMIGEAQQCFDLRDESGNKITGDGELEAAAFAHFHKL